MYPAACPLQYKTECSSIYTSRANSYTNPIMHTNHTWHLESL